ncbi:GNAT family N-acetyltransferase [Luteimicrobium subarcticum]|uniref:Ribosomal protein S18 acetylase RimI-like enzyme n=1 Tax=Luteimicrobium subarcticum TaxID=620910 RepID=A0A2M8W3I9_9MICO|nr:GNAT family N-acetyltransferase [Luteimicrobium subarcticum]PJI85459.1 ribosomal protein S18 acetylase RimI-like enzyme [Luteimicrobium subarcticum]
MRVDVEVRAARPDEVPELAALCVLARSEASTGAQVCSGERETVAGQLGVLLSVPGGFGLVAVSHGVVVGLVLGRTLGPTAFLERRVVYLEALYVRPDARRHGVGHALLAGVADRAVTDGAAEVYAMPAPGARGTQRFLARLGFAPAATHRVVTTTTLQRRLAVEHHPSRRRAHTGLEELIARRRRSRAGVSPERAPGTVRDPRTIDVAVDDLDDDRPTELGRLVG